MGLAIKRKDSHLEIQSTGGALPPAPASRRQRKAISSVMPDLGILNALMEDQAVGDILVNGTHSIYVDRHGKLVDSGLKFQTHEAVWEIAERIVQSVGQVLSHERPMIDTRLPDGSRVNIVAPPMAVDGVSISIRKFPSRHITLDTMVEAGHVTPELAKFLSECCAKRLNIIVCGGTGSGKTTLLNALSAHIGDDERVVTIEDSAELRFQQAHVVRLESKIELTQDKAHESVTIRDLLKNALRMRPDRIIVGESRGAEALDMLQAMNTGHDGSMTTIHANSSRDALSRLETMVSLAMPQLPIRLVRQQIAGTVNLIIHTSRCKDGVRRIMCVSEIAGMEGEVITMQDLIVYTEGTTDRQGYFRWANGAPRNQIVMDAARSSGMMRGMR
jgi:pilus assembly protein CpaF